MGKYIISTKLAARDCIRVGKLPKDAIVEIEVITIE